MLKGSPYASVVLDEQADTHCHACYSRFPAAASTVRCTDCSFAKYCSDACAAHDGALHKEECQILSEGDLPTTWAVRLLIRCLTRRMTDGALALNPVVKFLQPRDGGLPAEQLRWWAPVLASLRERFNTLDGSLDAASTQRWLSVVQNNAITLTAVDPAGNYDIRSVAAGLYLHASFFNQ